MNLLLGMTGVGGWLGKLNEHTNGWMISTENCGWQRCINQLLRVMTHFHPTSLPGPREPSAHCTLFKTSMAEAVNLFTIISLFISNNLFAHQCSSQGYLASTLALHFVIMCFYKLHLPLLSAGVRQPVPSIFLSLNNKKEEKKWATQAISTCS